MSVRLMAWVWDRMEYRDGGLFWIDGPNSGMRVGTVLRNGYRRVHYKGKNYPEHRLVWVWHTREMPKGHIDHINRIRDDNRIENLRDVSPLENAKNRGPRMPFGKRRYGD